MDVVRKSIDIIQFKIECTIASLVKGVFIKEVNDPLKEEVSTFARVRLNASSSGYGC